MRAISFSIISILTGAVTLYDHGLKMGGPAEMAYGWPLVTVFTLAVASKRTRTGWWRFYDVMWGLHIMDPVGREDTHNPFVILFGIIALAMSVLVTILLPKALKKKRNSRRLDS